MKSLVIDKIGHSEFRDISAPVPGNEEVLVDVDFVGLCGSDLNTFRGGNPLAELPRVPGHEIGGRIAPDSPVTAPGYEPGTAVIVIPYTACGSCPACQRGRKNACQFNRTLGVQQDGGLCSQIAVRPDRLIANSSLPAPHLALVEPLSVGFHAVDRGRVSAGETVLVLGGGMIGIGAVLGAMARGARVVVSEISAGKAEVLNSLGAAAVLNPLKTDLEPALRDLTGGRGADVVIEAAGVAETFRQAIDLAPHAGRVVYIGYAKSEVSYDTKYFNLKELDISGSRNATRGDFEAVIAYLERNPEVAGKLISRIVPWDEADRAFDYWLENRGETFKIIIDLREGA